MLLLVLVLVLLTSVMVYPRVRCQILLPLSGFAVCNNVIHYFYTELYVLKTREWLRNCLSHRSNNGAQDGGREAPQW